MKQEIQNEVVNKEIAKQVVKNESIDNELTRQDNIDKLIYEKDKLIYEKVFALLERVIAMEVAQSATNESNDRAIKSFINWNIAIVSLIVVSILIQITV